MQDDSPSLWGHVVFLAWEEKQKRTQRVTAVRLLHPKQSSSWKHLIHPDYFLPFFFLTFLIKPDTTTISCGFEPQPETISLPDTFVCKVDLQPGQKNDKPAGEGWKGWNSSFTATCTAPLRGLLAAQRLIIPTDSCRAAAAAHDERHSCVNQIKTRVFWHQFSR